jgi:ABC-2 type transport system permease protein
VTALIRAEWIKLRTVISHWVLAAIGVAFTPLVTILTAAFTNVRDVDPDTITEVTVGTTIVLGLLLGSLGVLSFAQEHAHGTIRVTYAAEPRRLRVLTAKAVVLAATATVVAAATVYTTYAVAIAVLEGRDEGLDLGGAAAHREALLGAVILCVLLTLLGYAIGLLIRNAPAAIAIFVLWPLLAENLIGALLITIFDDGALRWLPYSSGFQLIATDPTDDFFGRVPSGLYFAAWVVGLIAVGMAINTKRDA